MDLKKSKSILGEMLDICAMLEDNTFTETCTGIYNDVKSAKSVEDVITSARELMIFAEEQEWEIELKEELDGLYNGLLEEYDEL